MQRKSGWAGSCVPSAIGLGLLLALPVAVQAQASAAMRVQATVVSAEGMRSWQAVESRVHRPAAASAAGTSARATLATIVERTERSAQGARRVVNVDYLRN